MATTSPPQENPERLGGRKSADIMMQLEHTLDRSKPADRKRKCCFALRFGFMVRIFLLALLKLSTLFLFLIKAHNLIQFDIKRFHS